ncbi:XdhC family protein [Marilutibacter aestuarii]|uniref:XdhC family protein n=1 Tax=Marilutibacter aestuarii TaxID=1706195 RepID=A0A508AMC9_9GAMM|nr:XdhC/CoxI family protein [Lysobacter aestuarii]TQD50627.1 XdhC family protein [Lysobacter aestuarii]
METVARRIAANDVDAGEASSPLPGFLATGHPRPVLAAAARASRGVLAMVLETEGSTYVDPGAMACFTGDRQVGWLSGGCLEAELARRAAMADAEGRIDWIEIDTRDDEALFSGSAIGCRGRLRIALLPLRLMPGAGTVLDAWWDGGASLERHIDATGRVGLVLGGLQCEWQLPAAPAAWQGGRHAWTLPLPRPPSALVLGAGPETDTLLHLLGELGWRRTLCEPRARWREAGNAADARHADASTGPRLARDGHDAVLVMHHDFERDREALEAAANGPAGFVGLLGPPRRRDDLLKLLRADVREALASRLRAPVGIDLGGKGPEAIALSIAAQLQQWRSQAGRP